MWGSWLPGCHYNVVDEENELFFGDDDQEKVKLSPDLDEALKEEVLTSYLEKCSGS